MTSARTSRVWCTIPLIITIFSLSLPAYAQYSGGTGEPNDRYNRISTAEDTSQPAVWVLYDRDPDYENPPFGDTLTGLSSSGEILMRRPGFNICDTIGAWRMLSAVSSDETVVVCDIVAKRMAKYDFIGNEVFVLQRPLDATDVANDGTVYALISDGTIYGGGILRVSPDGNLVESESPGGVDLAIDEVLGGIYVVGADVKYYGLDLTLKWTIDPIGWSAVSVDTCSDGTAWVAERQYELSKGADRLLHVSAEGTILQTLDVGDTPRCVRVDRRDDSVYIASDQLYKYDKNGTLQFGAPLAEGGGWSLAMDPDRRGVWVGTMRDVRLISHEGATLLVVDEFAGVGQKYVACPKAMSLSTWTFVETCEVSVGSNYATSSGVTVADFDHNGQQDFVVVETLTANPPDWGATAYAFHNMGECTFTTSILLPSAGSYGYSAYTADLNNDGWSDAVFGSHGAKRVLLNDTQGGFTEVWSDPIGGGWGGIDLADIDGDGFKDFVSGAQIESDGRSMSGALLRVYLNDGTGSFAPSWTSEHYGESYTVFEHTLVARLNDDPYPDIVATVWQDPETLMTFLGDGTGTVFVPHEELHPTGFRFWALAVGNVNGDSRHDVAVHNGERLQVLTPDENGHLEPYWLGPPSPMCYDVTLADFDLDGRDDLFAREFESGKMYIYHNSGNEARFVLAWSAPAAQEAVPGVIADFDNDGFPDIIVRDAQCIRVLRNVVPAGTTRP